MKSYNLLLIAGVLIFLGVSPIGESHIIGKIEWVRGGAKGMKLMDWFDFFMHGGSLLIAFVLLLLVVRKNLTQKK